MSNINTTNSVNTSNAGVHPETAYRQKTAWVYLLNLIFYFIPLWFMRDDWARVAVSLLLILPFLYGYFWAYKSSAVQGKYPIALMLVTASVATIFTSGSISFFSFAGFFIGFFYSLRSAIISLILISIWLWLLNYMIGYEAYYFPLYGMLITFVVGLLGVVEHNNERIRRQQRQSNDEIANLATALERERIARDLHDIMGHNLSSIALKAQLAEKLLEAGELAVAKQHLQELADIARNSLTEIRQTVSNYKHKGLQDTVNQLCGLLRQKEIEVHLEGKLPPLTPLQESQLGLMLTELVNNMLKHSQASQCVWCFNTLDKHLVVNLSDNANAKTIKEGNGLKGIRERVSLLGGEFSYHINDGYHFSISLPLEAEQVSEPNTDNDTEQP
ncbi:sensor histidine kinase [Shewanella sp. UCD-KL21]|uniref:sensor histidine kinase n=1 Tax=Shewanella sp. UCD-KL21 TaxID=1917164 RepID=UPI0009FABB5E|nr:sensor histidine kinase [Shewanella sp. UCD-KL21]